MAQKTQPSNTEAEASILGAILLNPDISDEVFDFIQPRDFSDSRYRILYEVMFQLWKQEKAIDLIVIREELKKSGLFDKVGGGETLLEIQDRVPASANIHEYITIVHSKGILREVIKTAQGILDESLSEGADSDEILDRAEQQIFGISEKRDSALGNRIGDLLDPILERMKEGTSTAGIKTGFSDFDELTNGFQGGQFIIIAGRPGVGKSTFVLNIIEHLAVNDSIPSGIFSLEMDAELIAQNILLMHASVDSDALRKGRLSKSQHASLAMGIDRLKSAPVYIDDTPEPSVIRLRSRTRRWCRRYDLKMLAVDYLQLLQTGALNAFERRITNRENEIAFISRNLKLLASDLGIPIIAVSQLNREVDNRSDGKPRLSDLRESGAIEQDADIVVLMSREDYYGESENPVLANINVAKNRTGPTGEFQLVYDKKKFKFDQASLRTAEETY